MSDSDRRFGQVNDWAPAPCFLQGHKALIDHFSRKTLNRLGVRPEWKAMSYVEGRAVALPPCPSGTASFGASGTKKSVPASNARGVVQIDRSTSSYDPGYGKLMHWLDSEDLMYSGCTLEYLGRNFKHKQKRGSLKSWLQRSKQFEVFSWKGKDCVRVSEQLRKRKIIDVNDL